MPLLTRWQCNGVKDLHKGMCKIICSNTRDRKHLSFQLQICQLNFESGVLAEQLCCFTTTLICITNGDSSNTQHFKKKKKIIHLLSNVCVCVSKADTQMPFPTWNPIHCSHIGILFEKCIQFFSMWSEACLISSQLDWPHFHSKKITAPQNLNLNTQNIPISNTNPPQIIRHTQCIQTATTSPSARRQLTQLRG